jgi:hypothetical protein
VVVEMKNVVIRHEKVLTTTLIKHKEEIESATNCLQGTKQKFFVVQTKRKAWHAKSLSFESNAQLFKEQKQNIMSISKTRDNTLLEKIQDLKKQIQLTIAKEKKIIKQKEAKVKHDVEMVKWKALT